MSDLKAGQRVQVSHGYSYSQDENFRMLCDASRKELAAEFVAQWNPADHWGEKPPADKFAEWLIKQGYAERASDVAFWHVDADIDPS